MCVSEFPIIIILFAFNLILIRLTTIHIHIDLLLNHLFISIYTYLFIYFLFKEITRAISFGILHFKLIHSTSASSASSLYIHLVMYGLRSSVKNLLKHRYYYLGGGGSSYRINQRSFHQNRILRKDEKTKELLKILD